MQRSDRRSFIVLSCTLLASALLASLASADAVDDRRITGFEDASDWTMIEGAGQIVSDTDHTEAEQSILVDGSYWRRIQGAPVGSLGTGDRSILQLDVRLEGLGLAQWESIGLVLKVPSQGVYWHDLGQIPLNLLGEDWTTLSFSLPAPLQDAINATHQSDISVLISVNTESVSVRLDHLRFADSSDEEAPAPIVPLTLPSSGALGMPYTPVFQPCSTTPVVVDAVVAEFSNIWSGLETPETGRRTSLVPNAEIEFSHAIDPSMMNAAFVPVHVGMCGERIQASAPTTAALWTRTIPGNSVGVPADFNALVLDDLMGTPDAQGPLASGGDISMTNFSVNTVAQSPVGLFVGGAINLTNGTVVGDVIARSLWEPPQGVTLGNGQILDHSSAPDIAALFQSMANLTSSLGQTPANSDVQAQYGIVTLAGDSAELNVFDLDANQFVGANTLNIQVPPGAGALINVRGPSFILRNAGIQIVGANANRILWNLPQARDVSLSGVSFSGSLLAPHADVVFNNGNLAGTLVARSLYGTGELHHAPLDVELVLGSSTPFSPTFSPVRPLKPNCEYYFQIAHTQAVNSSGECLNQPLIIRFSTRAVGSGVEDDLVNMRQAIGAPGITEFDVRAGVFVVPEDALVRYAHLMGLPAEGTMDFDGTSRPHPVLTSATVIRARQFHEERLVDGPGLFIDVNQDDGVVHGRGRLIGSTSIAGEFEISPQEAVTTAEPYAILAGGDDAQIGDSEEAVQVYVNRNHSLANSEFVAAYRIPVWSPAGGEIGHVDVDATDGSLIRHSHLGEDAVHIQPYVDQMQAHTFVQHTPLFYNDADGQLSFVDGVMLTNPDGEDVHTLASADPTGTPQHPTLVAGYFLNGGEMVPGRDSIPGDQDGDGLLTNGDFYEARSASLASLFSGVAPSRGYLSAEGFLFNGGVWTGIKGTGLDVVAVEYEFDNTLGGKLPPRPFHVAALTTYLTDVSMRSVLLMNQSAAPTQDHEPIYEETAIHEVGHLVSSSVRLNAGRGRFLYAGEPGAISEAFSDIFAGAVRLANGDAESAWPLVRGWPSVEQRMARDTSAPLLSPTPHPNFYQSSGQAEPNDVEYDDNEGEECADATNDNCGVHRNSTIVSHWAHLLTVGRVAAGRCQVDVEPILGVGSDPQSSRHEVIQLLFDALPDLGEQEGFEALRDATYHLATLKDPAMGSRVAAAWLAVGLGHPVLPLPNSGSVNIDPWPTTLEIGFPIAGEVTIQIARDPEFSVGLVELTGTVEGPEISTVEQVLEPDTQYYWRAAPGSPGTQVAWADCSAGVWSFRTSKKDTTLETLTTDGDVHLTDFLGKFTVGAVPGAEEFELALGDPEGPGCAGTGDETLVAFSSGRDSDGFLGDSFDDPAMMHWTIYDPTFIGDVSYQATLPSFGMPRQVFDGYDVESTATLSITPIGPNGSRGTCRAFKVRKTDLGSFYQQALHQDDYFNSDDKHTDLTFDHLTGKLSDDSRFYFVKSTGAEAYELTIQARVRDETLGDYVLQDIHRSPREATGCGLGGGNVSVHWDPDACGDTDFLSRFGSGLPQATSGQFGTANHYVWGVTALDAYGQRRLSGWNGYYTSRGALAHFMWDGIPLDPTYPVDPHVVFRANGAWDSAPRVSDTGHLGYPLLPGLKDAVDAMFGVQVPWEEWAWIVKTPLAEEDRVTIDMCVPRQIPFVDLVRVRHVVGFWSGDTVDPLYSNTYDFDTSQFEQGEDCVEVAIKDPDNLAHRAYFFVQAAGPSQLLPPRGIRIAYFGSPDDDDDELLEPDECDDPPPPLDAPAAVIGTGIVACETLNSSIGSGVAPDGQLVNISEVICPSQLPQKTDFNFKFQAPAGATKMYLGICGEGGACKIFPYDSAEGSDYFGFQLSQPSSVGVDSPEDRYTIAAWAIDECGTYGEFYNSAFAYAGEGCHKCSLCDYCKETDPGCVLCL